MSGSMRLWLLCGWSIKTGCDVVYYAESNGAKFKGASADVADKITRQLTADLDRLRKK